MKIRTKFLLFMMLFVISIFIIIYFGSSRISKDRITEDINNHIITAVKFKAHNIETLLKNYKETTELLAVGVPVVQYFDADKDHKTREKNLKTRIDNSIKTHDPITRIRVLDAKGIVVASSHEDIGMDRSDSRIFLEGKKGTYIRDLNLSEFAGEYFISIAAPIYTNEKISGVLIINYAAEKQLFPIIADRTGLIHSTDIYLINKDHYLISPTRYGDTILKTKIVPEQIRLCRDDHIKNKIPEMDLKKQALYINYRGNKVMGTHSYISMMQWFLIVEVNEADLSRPIMKNRNLLAILFSTLLILSLIALYILSVFLTKPIKKLEAGIQEIAKGNLDHKVGTKRKDEIGQLSRVFDLVTTKLTKSQKELQKHTEELEKKIKERTADLEKQFKKSEKQRIATLVVLNDLNITTKDLRTEITKHKKTEKELEKYRNHLEKLVKERTTELEEKNAELQRLNKLFVGREFRIKELRDKVKELEGKMKRE